MPENVMNNTTNAVFIPTIIANKVLGRLPSYFSVAKNVSKSSDWTTAVKGATVQVTKTGAVVANDKVAGVNFTKQNPTGTKVDVTLNKHKEVTFTIDDVTKVLEQEGEQDRYGQDGAIALSEAVESDLMLLHPSIQNTITWDRTSEDTIDATMLKLRKYFTDNKVPRIEQKYFACDATVFNDLLGVDKYTRNDARGANGSISEGVVVRTYGFEISESQLVSYTGSPGAYHNMAYAKDAMCLASRPLPAPKGFGGQYSIVNDEDIGISVRTLFWYNADLGAHQLTIDLLYGVAVIDQRRLVEVESF